MPLTRSQSAHLEGTNLRDESIHSNKHCVPQVNCGPSFFYLHDSHQSPKFGLASSIRSSKHSSIRSNKSKYVKEALDNEIAVKLIELEVTKLQAKRRSLDLIEDFGDQNSDIEKEDEMSRSEIGQQNVKNYTNVRTSRRCSNCDSEKHIATVPLPKIEIGKFDGKPRNFWKFMKSFEANISNRVSDDHQRLMYLMHYCCGEALSAIDDCVLLPENEGFKRAMTILTSQFGRSHDIVESYINDLLNGDHIAADDVDALRELTRQMNSSDIALTQMNRTTYLNCPDNLKRIVGRLPKFLQREWAKLADDIMESASEPSFRQLVNFLEKNLSIATNSYGRLISSARKPAAKREAFSSYRSRVNAITLSDSRCHVCSDFHHITECSQFVSMAHEDKIRTLREIRVCFNCLRPNHLAVDCKDSVRCKEPGCNRRHHVLLHMKRQTNYNLSTATINSAAVECSSSYLGFIPIRLFGPHGSVLTYAFLDSGSDSTLLSADVAQQLGLDGETVHLEITSIDGTSVRETKVISFDIESIKDHYRLSVDKAYVVDRLPMPKACVPREPLSENWPHLRDVELLHVPASKVSILIGINVPEAHWVLEQRIGTSKQPYASLTVLGWVLYGPSGNKKRQTACVNYVSTHNSIEADVLRMFEREFKDITDEEVMYSVEDKYVLERAKESTRLIEGHYYMKLPWKIDWRELPDSRYLADKRMTYLTKRLTKDAELLSRYSTIMSDYERKGFISENTGRYTDKLRFVPHHPVFNSHKPGKMRIVFDCAASVQNYSLNDCLYSGPDLANDLTGVLMRFRLHEIAMSADIEEMFLQVRLHPEDRTSLSFLWHSTGDITQPPNIYHMNVHPFGATSSPFCATFALRRTAEDNSELFDESTVTAVKNNFYVDDCLISVDSVTAAKRIIAQLVEMLHLGGFRLHKWVCNNDDVLRDTPITERATELVDLNPSDPAVVKTLGLYWAVSPDQFTFRVQLPTRPVTRRGILSCAASLYDPLGFVAPLTLQPKRLLQRLCHQKCGWDDHADDATAELWELWLSDIKEVESILIPRCFRPIGFVVCQSSLHLFSDASEVGYGAVAYMSSTSVAGQVCCSFIMGKSRVSPLKSVTIPRLELQAAVLAVRLKRHILKESGLHFNAVYLWTDSMIVLHYIRNTNSRYKTFVANRTEFIRQNSDPSQWRHVPTAENPADHASRGIGDRQYQALQMWLHGPKFLLSRDQCWPNSDTSNYNMPISDLETKKEGIVMLVVTLNDAMDKVITYYSVWTKLVRAMAWFSRFKSFLISKLDVSGNLKISQVLLTHDLEEAEYAILLYTQKQCFPEVFGHMLKHFVFSEPVHINKTSPLRKLTPIICNGLLCVGGRLRSSNVYQPSKYPIILPSNHAVTRCIINQYHDMEGHVGTMHVLSAIRRKYWILKGAATIKRIIHKCISCKMRSAKPVEQIMCELPPARSIPDFPFAITGVDYFGPMTVRVGRTTRKRYGCLFTCLKTRAVHIEVAQSLSIDSFLMSFSRFANRRGYPKEMYSDQGSNFVGAEVELRQFIITLQGDHVREKLLEKRIDWHFNPPHASHRGGVWERLIRSVRRILSAVSREQTYTDESLNTFLTEVERILNSRPLVPLYEDSDQIDVLTPNHVLLMREPTIYCGEHINLRERYTRYWRQGQALADVFWRRWMNEYVPLLQLRQKWTKIKRDLRVGDYVLVLGETQSRGSWTKGIISNTEVGRDGHVRTVTVRTNSGSIKRDIRKVCLLEGIEDD